MTVAPGQEPAFILMRETTTMADDITVEKAIDAVVAFISKDSDDFLHFCSALDALIAAVRAEKVCTCGAMKRSNAKYGHLHWCPLWTDLTLKQ